jgi:hypothetical protein
VQREPGQYSDILRTIGRLLDEREARETVAQVGTTARLQDTEIIDHEAFMTVYWTSAGCTKEESYTDSVISELLAEARRLRGRASDQPAGDRRELLRTLGEELDAEGISFNGITEKDEAFVVSGIAQGRYINLWYPHEDLRALSQERRPSRAALAPQAGPVSPARPESRWGFFRRKPEA